MGRGLEGNWREVVYLDTHIAIWLAQGDDDAVSPSTRRKLSQSEVLVSPMVVLEMEYLHEIGRSRLTADEIMLKLAAQAGVSICSLSFAKVVRAAQQDKWTRDPFDRLIVANAKANGLAWLITSDQKIHAYYQRALL